MTDQALVDKIELFLHRRIYKKSFTIEGLAREIAELVEDHKAPL